MVAVKNCHKFARGYCHGMIDIARLGVIVFVAFDITGSNLFGKLRKQRSAAVIQYVDMEFFSGPLQI